MGCEIHYDIKRHACHGHVAEDAPAYAARAPGARRDGEALRLAASLVQGARLASKDRINARNKLKHFCARAVGQDVARNGSVYTDDELGPALMALSRHSDRLLSEQLELLIRFDDTKLYMHDGCRTMTQWMDLFLGMARVTACEHLRVGRALRDLPVCAALFALGKLSYSKARFVTRYATPQTDEAFASATLDLSSSETQAWCERFRHESDAAALAAAEDREAQAALMAHERRALRARDLNEHSTRITLDLPKDTAAEFLRSLEQCDDEVTNEIREHSSRDDAPSSIQRRADAAVLMSRRSLAHAGEAVSMADRFRVHVNVEASSLSAGASAPATKPLINGCTPIPTATARRIAELAGYTLYANDGDGNPVGSRRVAAPFTQRQLRALRARDGCCQMPGCNATRHLDGHHVLPRSEGGRSTLDNAVLLCGGCHRLLHEGGFRLERAPLAECTPADTLRRYRLFGADGVEYGSRGAAMRWVKSEDPFTRVAIRSFDKTSQ